LAAVLLAAHISLHLSPPPLLYFAMAPQMKRKTMGGRNADPIKTRCDMVKHAIASAEHCSKSVKDMLGSTIPVTIGTYKADRHPFNDRFVAMIGEVLVAQQAHLTHDLASKEAAFAELTPAKANREAVHDQTKADAVAKGEAAEAAKQAHTATGAAVKDASAALKEAQKAEKSGNESLEATSARKATLEGTQKDSLGPLMDGSSENKTKMAKAVLAVGKSFEFDASLLATAEPVLFKEVAERGSFDATCLEQLQAAFASAVAALDEQLAAGAPGKAERAAVVANAEAAKQGAEAARADAMEKAQAAKAAKAAADASEKEAAQSLEHFMPDLKKCGDALDTAKEDVTEFNDGPLKAFHELQDAKDGDFAPPPKESPAKKARAEAETGDADVDMQHAQEQHQEAA